MTTYVALLRAVNVGGANRIKMDRLRAGFVTCGYAGAVTHIQSGNVIFMSKQSAAVVKRSVESMILDEFGISITAIIRTDKQLAAVTRPATTRCASRAPRSSSATSTVPAGAN